MNSRVLGVSEFKYIIGIFIGSKGVAMATEFKLATEFKQTSAKIALVLVVCKKSRNFSCE